MKSASLRDFLGAGAVKAIEVAAVSSEDKDQAALGGGTSTRKTPDSARDAGATGTAPIRPTTLSVPPLPLSPPRSDEYFPPLSRNVSIKIGRYGRDAQHSPHAVLPEENVRWFHWWVATHPLTPVTQKSTEVCVEDAKRDGVLPDDMAVLPNGTPVITFVRHQLKTVKSQLRQKLQASLN